jgi:signal transduction histidine kinase/ActR/RegA family two-component response regulator
LITGVGVICLLVVLTSVGSLLMSRMIIASVANVAVQRSNDLADVRALQLAGARNISDVQSVLLTGADDAAIAAIAGSTRIRERIAHLRTRVTDAEGIALLDGVAAAERDHRDAYEQTLQLRAAGGRTVPPTYPALVQIRGVDLDHALAGLVSHVEASQLRELSSSQAAMGRAQTLLIVITLVTILLLVLLCAFTLSGLERSFRFQQNARALAEQGQSEARVTLSEVEAVSHLKDEFLATVSHELRNPLAPILTWTQLLRSGTLDPEKTARALEVIERNVNSQTRLIDDLVDVSRVVAGKFRLDVRPIDLVPVIRSAAESLSPASTAKQIRVQLVLDERTGMVTGDSERLQQVMSNLISNAIKFTPKEGSVQVVLQRAESHVEIVVSDTGIGIDPVFLPHMFEPFRQGTGGPMRRHAGLGLGLSIVRHIVELHGGEIFASSGGLNLGSKFTVKLPLLAMSRSGAEAVRVHPTVGDRIADAGPGRLDGIRVLVVDDEPSASEALLALFGSCGAESRIADSSAEAYAMFGSWRPDVVVSDIAMPGEDGYSLIRKIRLLPVDTGGNVPAVALTAYAKIEDRVTILSAGFQMYLSKPANPNELVAVVGSLARRRRPAEGSVA